MTITLGTVRKDFLYLIIDITFGKFFEYLLKSHFFNHVEEDETHELLKIY